MKKVCFVAGILFFSATGFAQQSVIKVVQLPDTVIQKTTTPEERINKLGTAINKMQKQSLQTQYILPANDKKKKLVVSRVGSKQVNWSSEY